MFEFDEFKAINMVSLVDMEDVETLDLDLRTKEELRVKSNMETQPHQLGRREGQVTYLNTQLEKREQLLITYMLNANVDIFTWSTCNMSDIDPNYHCHHLEICRDANQ